MTDILPDVDPTHSWCSTDVGEKVRKGERNQGSLGFPGGAVVKNPPANAVDTGSSSGLGRPHMLWSN